VLTGVIASPGLLLLGSRTRDQDEASIFGFSDDPVNSLLETVPEVMIPPSLGS
jgi:hypothetical protein